MASLQVILAIAICATCTLAINPSVIKMKPLVVIGEQKTSLNATLGAVKNVRSCGGSAQVNQWRYATCLKADKVCHVPTDAGLRTAQLDFVPGSDIAKPALRLIVKSNDGKVNSTYDDGSVIVNNGVKKGIAYTVTCIGGVTQELKGKDAIFNFIIYDLANGSTQLCAETDLQFD